MIAILKQNGKHNRIKIYGADGGEVASFSPEYFAKCYSGDFKMSELELLEKIWKERSLEIPEDKPV